MDPAHPKQFLRYDSIPDSINDAARNLSQNFLQQELVTIPQIAQKYSHIGASNDPNKTNAQWPGQVSRIYQQFGGTKTNFGPTGVADAVNTRATTAGGNNLQRRTSRGA